METKNEIEERSRTLLRAAVRMLTFRRSNEICLIKGDQEALIHNCCTADWDYGYGWKEFPHPDTKEAMKLESAFLAYNRIQIDKLIVIINKLWEEYEIEVFTFDEIKTLIEAICDYKGTINGLSYDGENLKITPETSPILSNVCKTMSELFDDEELMENKDNALYWKEEMERVSKAEKYIRKLLPRYTWVIEAIGVDCQILEE